MMLSLLPVTISIQVNQRCLKRYVMIVSLQRSQGKSVFLQLIHVLIQGKIAREYIN
jgi:hypothetical protein